MVLADMRACTTSGLTAGPGGITDVLKARCWVTAPMRPRTLCLKRAKSDKPMPCALLQGVDMLARKEKFQGV